MRTTKRTVIVVEEGDSLEIQFGNSRIYLSDWNCNIDLDEVHGVRITNLLDQKQAVYVGNGEPLCATGLFVDTTGPGIAVWPVEDDSGEVGDDPAFDSIGRFRIAV